MSKYHADNGNFRRLKLKNSEFLSSISEKHNKKICAFLRYLRETQKKKSAPLSLICEKSQKIICESQRYLRELYNKIISINLYNLRDLYKQISAFLWNQQELYNKDNCASQHYLLGISKKTSANLSGIRGKHKRKYLRFSVLSAGVNKH